MSWLPLPRLKLQLGYKSVKCCCANDSQCRRRTERSSHQFGRNTTQLRIPSFCNSFKTHATSTHVNTTFIISWPLSYTCSHTSILCKESCSTKQDRVVYTRTKRDFVTPAGRSDTAVFSASENNINRRCLHALLDCCLISDAHRFIFWFVSLSFVCLVSCCRRNWFL